MDSKLLLQSNYLDIIFDGRNKQYGGYALRSSYPQRMRKAGVFIFSAALLMCFYSVWASRSKPLPVMPLATKPDTLAFINTKFDKPDKPLIRPKIEGGAPSVNTEKLTVPDVVIDDEVKPEDKPATQEELKTAVAGKVTMTGDKIGDESLGVIEGNPNGNGGGATEGGGGNAKIKAPEIPTFVEQDPEFPGGEKALQEYLSSHLRYPAAAVNAGKQGKVLVKFVVNEDGSISSVIPYRGFGFGSEEETMRVVSGMPKWKPGRNNGVATKVWFQLPVTFSLN